MSDVEQLFWVLTALTLTFSLIWVRPGGVAFVSFFGVRTWLQWPSGHAVLRNDHGGLLLGPVVPFGTAVVSAPWPFAVSPQGLLATSSTTPTLDQRIPESGEFFAFAEVKTISHDGRVIFVNGRRFVVAGSKTAASTWVRWLRELKEKPEAERGGMIEAALAGSCDLAAAKRVLAESKWPIRWVRFAATALFVYCFAMLGVAAFCDYPVEFLRAVQNYALLVVMTFLFYRLAERPDFDPPRSGHSWMILISPADAFRSADHLLGPRVERFHPVVLSHLLASRAANRDFLRHVIRDVAFPLPGASTTPNAVETAAWFSERMQRALAGFFHEAAIDPAHDLAPPPPDDTSARGFCPRCECQFVRDTGSCSSCGISLHSFAVPLESPQWLTEPLLPSGLNPVPVPPPPTPPVPASSPPKKPEPRSARKRSKRKR